MTEQRRQSIASANSLVDEAAAFPLTLTLVSATIDDSVGSHRTAPAPASVHCVLRCISCDLISKERRLREQTDGASPSIQPSAAARARNDVDDGDVKTGDEDTMVTQDTVTFTENACAASTQEQRSSSSLIERSKSIHFEQNSFRFRISDSDAEKIFICIRPDSTTVAANTAHSTMESVDDAANEASPIQIVGSVPVFSLRVGEEVETTAACIGNDGVSRAEVTVRLLRHHMDSALPTPRHDIHLPDQNDDHATLHQQSSAAHKSASSWKSSPHQKDLSATGDGGTTGVEKVNNKYGGVRPATPPVVTMPASSAAISYCSVTGVIPPVHPTKTSEAAIERLVAEEEEMLRNSRAATAEPSPQMASISPRTPPPPAALHSTPGATPASKKYLKSDGCAMKGSERLDRVLRAYEELANRDDTNQPSVGSNTASPKTPYFATDDGRATPIGRASRTEGRTPSVASGDQPFSPNSDAGAGGRGRGGGTDDVGRELQLYDERQHRKSSAKDRRHSQYSHYTVDDDEDDSTDDEDIEAALEMEIQKTRNLLAGSDGKVTESQSSENAAPGSPDAQHGAGRKSLREIKEGWAARKSAASIAAIEQGEGSPREKALRSIASAGRAHSAVVAAAAAAASAQERKRKDEEQRQMNTTGGGGRAGGSMVLVPLSAKPAEEGGVELSPDMTSGSHKQVPPPKTAGRKGEMKGYDTMPGHRYVNHGPTLRLLSQLLTESRSETTSHFSRAQSENGKRFSFTRTPQPASTMTPDDPPLPQALQAAAKKDEHEKDQKTSGVEATGSAHSSPNMMAKRLSQTSTMSGVSTTQRRSRRGTKHFDEEAALLEARAAENDTSDDDNDAKISGVDHTSTPVKHHNAREGEVAHEGANSGKTKPNVPAIPGVPISHHRHAGDVLSYDQSPLRAACSSLSPPREYDEVFGVVAKYYVESSTIRSSVTSPSSSAASSARESGRDSPPPPAAAEEEAPADDVPHPAEDDAESEPEQHVSSEAEAAVKRAPRHEDHTTEDTQGKPADDAPKTADEDARVVDEEAPHERDGDGDEINSSQATPPSPSPSANVVADAAAAEGKATDADPDARPGDVEENDETTPHDSVGSGGRATEDAAPENGDTSSPEDAVQPEHGSARSGGDDDQHAAATDNAADDAEQNHGHTSNQPPRSGEGQVSDVNSPASQPFSSPSNDGHDLSERSHKGPKWKSKETVYEFDLELFVAVALRHSSHPMETLGAVEADHRMLLEDLESVSRAMTITASRRGMIGVLDVIHERKRLAQQSAIEVTTDQELLNAIRGRWRKDYGQFLRGRIDRKSVAVGAPIEERECLAMHHEDKYSQCRASIVERGEKIFDECHFGAHQLAKDTRSKINLLAQQMDAEKMIIVQNEMKHRARITFTLQEMEDTDEPAFRRTLAMKELVEFKDLHTYIHGLLALAKMQEATGIRQRAFLTDVEEQERAVLFDDEWLVRSKHIFAMFEEEARRITFDHEDAKVRAALKDRWAVTKQTAKINKLVMAKLMEVQTAQTKRRTAVLWEMRADWEMLLEGEKEQRPAC